MAIDYISLSNVVSSIGLPTVLSWLGFSNVSEDYNSVRASCAVHGGDRKDSFCMYKNTLVWKCFSRKCEQKYGETFFSLVATVLNCSRAEAIKEFCWWGQTPPATRHLTTNSD